MKKVALLAVLTTFACFGETLFDVDFTAATRRVDAEGKGSFHGVLPARMGENFAGWAAGHVTSELREEGGRRFLRVTTLPGEMGGQFAIAGFEPKFPGYFRLKLTGRVSKGGSLAFGLRLNGSPYTSYSEHSFAATDWKEETYLFLVRPTRPGSVGMYIYTGAGTVDLVRMTLETATEADFTATIARPPKSQRDYVRHARFPLGLPCGWNLGRDCIDTVCVADTQEPAEDGVPVLKVVSGTPWELRGEAFQTAYPEESHTASFRYRSTEKAQIAVMDDRGQWVGSQLLPPSAGWRVARLVFRPKKLSNSFGLRFWGEKGVFRLDQVRVHAGTGEPPPQPYSCAVSLAVVKGEIAGDTRIQYVEEGTAEVACHVLNAPAGSVLRAKVLDIYGREKALPPQPVPAGGTCSLDYGVFPDCPVGQFRVTAWTEKAGVRVSPDEELVVTRIPRPVAWGRDAPDSPFGSHFNPCRGVVKTLKAGGVNWVRLHDAGSQVSGWYAVEPEKGKWNFHDAEVACYRNAHMKIFAQLGTAPAWATHYGDLGYTHMGYFEKYLRPTNSVDWVNYVSAYVRHHERNIDEYFIWNEPWGGWWKSAADIKWYDVQAAGADFAALSRLAYAAVKKVNPAIRVSGFNSTAGDGGRQWTADVLAGGGFDCCDIIDWHYYTPHPRGLRGEASISETPLKPIRERHPDLGGKPFYMSEGQGTSSGTSGVAHRMSGLLKASVPWPAEDVETYSRMADMTSRYILSLLAEGNSKVFLYSSHAYQGLAVKPNFLVLLGPDGFAHPALVAHAQLARAIEGRRFVRREDAGRAGVKYVFTGRGKTVRVYSDLAKDEVFALSAQGPLKDLYGNRVGAETYVSGTVVYAAW